MMEIENYGNSHKILPITLMYIYVFNCSIKNSAEISQTATIGGSFHSDRSSIGHALADEPRSVEKPRHVSLLRLYSMIGPYWHYGVFGTLAAFTTGALMPLFALGISHALVSYYMDWDSTRHEVKKIAFLFCGAAIVAITAYSIEHLSFGIMGERLTLRVRGK
jgi:ATP-binding cassette, subfamily B (MDR/TAP), member 1